MGSSTKQVSGDHGFDWSQIFLQSGGVEAEPPKAPASTRRQQPQTEPLKCPRCDSTNTKFCYYNNYNKSQPRHFCKACKRHWTKGGTLRNVPVGGGQKNKRIKTSNAATSSTSTATPATSDNQLVDSRNSFAAKSFTGNNGVFTTGSILSATKHQSPEFPFSTLSSFDIDPPLICNSYQSLNTYNFSGDLDAVEELSTITTVNPSTSSVMEFPWTVPMDVPYYWNWNDMDLLNSADLSWEDTDIKP